MTKLFELLDEVGFPPGVLNMVHGGREVVSSIIKHPDIKGVSFVGSTPVGRDVVFKEGAAHGKRVQAQCGAKNFLVVMPDAKVSQTVASIMTSFYGNTGQRCLSGANLLIVGEDGFYENFMDAVKGITKSIRIGYGLDESVQMGPLRSPDKKKRVLGYIDKGLEEGARPQDLLGHGRNKRRVLGRIDVDDLVTEVRVDRPLDVSGEQALKHGARVSNLHFERVLSLIHI